MIKKILSSYYLSLILFILAFFLRYKNFDNLGYWSDEHFTFWLSEPNFNFDKIFDKVKKVKEFAPPIYYYFLNKFSYYFKYSADSLRLIHIFFGSMNVLIAFIISRFFLSKAASNLLLFLLGTNVFLIWSSNEVRIVSFALFFQLITILFFIKFLKKINKIKIWDLFFLIFFNLICLSVHPLSFIIISSQIILLFLIFLKKKNLLYLRYINAAFISFILYLIFNKEYILYSISNTSIPHNSLTLGFLIGYNFKSYFSSYILAIINILLIFFSFLKIKKNFNNLKIFYLWIIFIKTYVFIIIGTLLFTGINSPRYWSYLIPIIILINIYYLMLLKEKFFFKQIIIITLIFSTVITYITNINKPQIRKPDTPGLIKTINEFNVNYLFINSSDTLINNYLSNGYKILNKNIILNNIKNINNNFWYLCIDHYSHQEKGSYWNDCYDCSPKYEFIKNHKKTKTIRINGYMLSKFELL